MNRRPMLILIRGLPGSGKTTAAKAYANAGFVHCEADHFFEGLNGYQFDAKKIGDAHAACLDRAIRAMNDARNVVVSNTFTMRWEMKPYIEEAERYGYETSEMVMRGDYGSTHNVPGTAIERMRARWED